MKKRLVILVIALILIMGFTFPGFAAKKLISIGATGQASSYYAYHVAVAQLLNKNIPEIQVSVVETGGGADNLKRIAQGEVEWGQTSEPDAYECYKGIGLWQNQGPSPDLRLYWAVHPIVYFFVVREDSGINSLEELDGKKFNPGGSGSSTERLTEKTLNLLGIKPEYYRGGYSDVVEAIKNRRINGYVKSASISKPDATILDLSTAAKIKILDFKDDDIAKINNTVPYWDFTKVPGGLYPGVGEVQTLSHCFAMAGTKNLSEDLVYKIVKVIWQNVDYQAESFPAVKGINLAESTIKYGRAPLHPGTIKYLKELGYEIPDRLIPPEMK